MALQGEEVSLRPRWQTRMILLNDRRDLLPVLLACCHRAFPSTDRSLCLFAPIPLRSPKAAIRATIGARTIARKVSEKGAAPKGYREFMAPEATSCRAARNAP